jgi:hypothetical protein
MSEAFRRIAVELLRPDAQNGDWLAWASNQLSHAFIGSILTSTALLFNHGVWISVISATLFYALIKEFPDFLRDPRWATARDSTQDSLFVFGGALLIAAVSLVQIWIFTFALVAVLTGLGLGIWQRVKIKV